MYSNSLCKYVRRKRFQSSCSRLNFLDELAGKRLPCRLGGLTVLLTYEQSFGKVKIPQLIVVYWILLEKIKQVDVVKRGHRANKFTDNKFIYGTHSTPVLTECSRDHFPTLRTWVTCVNIHRSEVYPILTLVVKFKLNLTSVAQVRAPASTPYVHRCQTGKSLQSWHGDMGMGLVGPAPSPPPHLLPYLFLHQSEAHVGPRKIEAGPPYYLGVWMSGAPH